MNLIFNSRLISFLWWIAAPFLVAKIIISIFTIFISAPNTKEYVENSHDKLGLITLPKILGSVTSIQKKRTNVKTKKVQKLDGISLLACYVDQKTKFIIIKDKAKTLFIDINSTYKGAKLKTITNASAVFMREGEEFKLFIQKVKQSAKNSKNAINNDIESSGKYITVQRSEFQKYTKNMRRALRDIRFQRVTNHRRFSGIRLSFIRKGSLFDKMGLKRDDILKSVNGRELKSIVDLIPYYRQLDGTTTLSLGIEREKEMREIIYEIN